MHFFLRYWLPVVLLCLAIYVQSAFPTLDVFPPVAWSDKLAHMMVYGLLGALFCRAFGGHARWRGRWGFLFLFGVTAATLYGASDEWHQSFVAQRTAEWADLAADFAGSAIGCGLHLVGRFRKRTRSGVP